MARTRVGSRGSFSGQVIERLTAAETISNGDSGKVFALESSGGAFTATMPTTLKAGVNYRFVVEDSSQIVTLAFGSAIVYGNLEQEAGDNETNRVASAGVSNIIISANALQGDYVDVLCMGAYWFASGMSSVQTAVSTS